MNMEREEIISNEFVDSPHFDDERTLLTAQPVIPLAEVDHKLKTRRWLGLALALIVAVGLGGGAALLLVRLRHDGSTEIEAAESSETVLKPAENESEDPTKPETAQDASVAVAGETQLPEKPATEQKGAAHDDSKRVARRSSGSRVVKESTDPVRVKADDSNGNEPILVDQWQEKRLRRVSRRERARGNHHRRDLFRIRDIFEGTRPE